MIRSLLDRWKDDGIVVLENAVSSDDVDRYVNFWYSHHGGPDRRNIANRYGWDYFTSYLHHPEILDIMCSDQISATLTELSGVDKVGIHLSFTFFYSIERSWHRDMVALDKEIADNYFGVWIALEDINEKSGPYTYIPGSHKWDLSSLQKYVTQPDSPEGNIELNNYVQSASAVREVTVLPRKGTVFIWNGHLVHSVPIPTNNNVPRKCVIGHFGSASKGLLSGVQDKIKPHKNGWYFDLEENKEESKKSFSSYRRNEEQHEQR